MHKRDFEQFYKTNIDRIYRYVFFRVGRNREICEDLVSEIFMKALDHFEDFDPKISRSAWIYRIAHNHLANFYRDKKPEIVIDEVEIVEPTELVKSVESKTQLQEVLHELPFEDRRIVTMKYLEGYNYDEIGEILGRTAGAVKMTAHRAMKKLKKIYRQ